MIYLGTDHAGYELKEKLKKHLEERHIPYEDLGSYTPESVDYPDYAFAVADRVAASRDDDKGILLCNTGVGVCIAANKVPGVLAAIGFSEAVTKRARNDEGVNVLCLPAQAMDEDEAMRAVDAFIDTPFSHAERHERRVGKIEAREPRIDLPSEAVRAAVRDRIDELATADFAAKLWTKDPSIWKDDAGVRDNIFHRLGWLGAAETMTPHTNELKAFAKDLATAGFTDAALLGMGGSSLAPYVFSEVFGVAPGYLRLHVLDTTDPDMLSTFLSDVDLSKTVFVAASKSGTTIEPLAQMALFGRELVDAGLEIADHFIALTDPGTPLETSAEKNGFRRLFTTPADVGGRYSALTYFGMVPAALLGVDVVEIAARGRAMESECGPDVAVSENPAVALGALIAEAARGGRDKLTLVASEQIAAFTLWVEQLVAESTGKEGHGVIPIVGEKPGVPGVYGRDRLFVVLRLASDESLRHWAADMRQAGHLVEELTLKDHYDLGGEFVRWEMATATAGAVLGINPFDEPNVAEAKKTTQELLEAGGGLPEPDGRFDDSALFLSPAARAAMAGADLSSPRGAVSALAGAIRPADYFGLLAFLPMDGRVDAPLDRIRLALRDRLGVATCLEYGPRYLHSTGQAYKGGPNTGVFLIVSRQPGVDQEVPGERYTFGELQLAQAHGDFQTLSRHERRVMWLHLTAGDHTELAELAAAIESGLA